MRALYLMTASPSAMGAWSLLLGIVLWFAPASFVARIRAVALDIVQPGVSVANLCRDGVAEWVADRETQAVSELRSQLEQARVEAAHLAERLRRLTIQTAELAESADVAKSQSDAGSETPPLFVPAIVEARLIGETLAQEWRSGALLDRGWSAGIRESALVVSGRRPLIDLGQADQLSAEDPLIVGRTVLGKVETVGRWTSTYLSVTDPDYRGPAQIVRESAEGPVWGAKGVLRGDGMHCRLEQIPVDAHVRVGDAVYTAGRDGALEAPLYYGRVSEAQLGASDREWHITVEPAALPSTVTRVQVLRAALNPNRLWTH